jgi:hypothetical protein
MISPPGHWHNPLVPADNAAIAINTPQHLVRSSVEGDAPSTRMLHSHCLRLQLDLGQVYWAGDNQLRRAARTPRPKDLPVRGLYLLAAGDARAMLGHGPETDAVDAKEETVERAGREEGVPHTLEKSAHLKNCIS